MIKPYTDFNPAAEKNVAVTIGNGRKQRSINIAPIGFDIETTNDETTQAVYMTHSEEYVTRHGRRS